MNTLLVFHDNKHVHIVIAEGDTHANLYEGFQHASKNFSGRFRCFFARFKKEVGFKTNLDYAREQFKVSCKIPEINATARLIRRWMDARFPDNKPKTNEQ